jgi:hypothetical protein
MALKSKPPAMRVVVDSIIRTIVFLSSEADNFAELKNQNGGSWGYEPPR